MSASLIVLLPVILLGIVSSLCFVGCVLQTGGLGGATNYSLGTVLPTPGIVAYWPLDEIDDNQSDGKSNNHAAFDHTPDPSNGGYIDPNTSSALYPWPEYSIPQASGPAVVSAGAPGSIQFGPGIVPGDIAPPFNNPNVRTTCPAVNGCFVSVPFAKKINPPAPFTLEAWVRSDWGIPPPPNLLPWRAVLDARTFNPCTGFAIVAMPMSDQPRVYQWAAIVGNGGNGDAGFSTVPSTAPIALGSTDYLAVTYDGQMLKLFVNAAQPASLATGYSPNTSSVLWIGAGIPFATNMRPQMDPTVVAGPLLPFDGAIQDVAIYGTALDPGVIKQHFTAGSPD
jgi:Concanavalin A-like lectin/glucanases superfamily